ncbi:MAG: rhamnulokinase, partial [Ruminococcaceae bacterium]|nr:rhamnulokinase [Oscillospiraceae bacterium]
MSNRVLAFDFGASSGRAILATFDGERIHMEEIHRFSNDPVNVCGVFHWDVLRLFHEIKQGITKAVHAGGFDAIGIDTWGVDFGLIDR